MTKPRSDQVICDDIRSRFDATSELNACAIRVESAVGEVTLSGDIANSNERASAIKIASHVYGVTFVHERMRLLG